MLTRRVRHVVRGGAEARGRARVITTLIEYPDKETRDMILGTGMADGMETSYARMEETVLASA